MKVWLIFIQGEDHIWLEGAWDDEMTVENHPGWEAEVNRCRQMATDNGYEMRIIAANVPGVYEAFEIPTVDATR